MGIDNIFTDFKMGNKTLAASNQFINCSFIDFPMTLYAQSVLSFAKNKVFMSNIKFQNIQTRVIDSQIKTQLIIEDSDISEIGTHIMYHLEDVAANSFLAHFKNILISKSDARYATPKQELPNGFLKAFEGNVEIKNSTFRHCMSKKGLIIATDDQRILIQSSKFSGLVGAEQASFIFAIQNELGEITVLDSVITDSISKSSLISLTFA